MTESQQVTQEEYDAYIALQNAQQQQQKQQQTQGTVIQSNPDFMQFLFKFKKEVSMPLRRLWRGEELNENGQWLAPQNEELRIMNEKGISWGISLIESYINSVYVVSNYDENSMNWTLKRVGRVVWNTLSLNYKKYDLAKHNIPRIANEIISKIHAILLGARGDGFRKFFTQTTTVNKQELYERNNERKGWIGKATQALFTQKP